MFINYSLSHGVTINLFSNNGCQVDIEDIVFAVHNKEQVDSTCSLDLQSAADFLCDGEAMELLGITDDMQDAVETVWDIITTYLKAN